MEISSNNLLNKDILQVNKFDNVKQENLKDKGSEQLKKVCNDFESFFLQQIIVWSNICNFRRIINLRCLSTIYAERDTTTVQDTCFRP